MRILTYGKTVKITPFAEFELIPMRVIDSENFALFDQILQAVKDAGCWYRLEEHRILLKEERKP